MGRSSDTMATLIDSLREHGSRCAIAALGKDDTEHLSFEKLADRSDRIAAGLRSAGVKQGSEVALLAENGISWVVCCLGVLKAAAVPVPVDAQFNDELLEHVLRDSKAVCVFTTTRHRKRIEKFKLKPKPEIIVFDGDESAAEHWSQLLSVDGKPNGDSPTIDPDDTTVLFYTSGTTGPPKGVPLTHRNLLSQRDAVLEAEVITSGDRILLPLPLHHVYPFVIGLLAPLWQGVGIIFPYALTGPELVRAMKEEHATAVIGVPRLYRALIGGVKGRIKSMGRIIGSALGALLRFSTFARRRLNIPVGRFLLLPLRRAIGPDLRLLASGGSKLDPEIAWELSGLGWELVEGYGLTETAPLLALNLPDDGRIGTVGKPLKNVEIRIDESAVDSDGDGDGGDADDDRARSDGTADHQEGEILARGPNVFSGYHNLPDKTEEATTSDGFFRTGDLGYFDEDGYLHITGRASTMIVTEGGENVQPDDIEDAYQRSEIIREIGVMQHDGGLVAVVVPESGAVETGDPDEVERAVRDAIGSQSKSLPSYKRLTDFRVIRTSLPRTRLGKLRRHELVNLYKEGETGQRNEEAGPISIDEMADEDQRLLDDPAARKTWEWLAERYPDRPLSPDSNMQVDLNVDSIEWLNITLEVGTRAGVELDEGAIEEIETVRDLLQRITDAAGTDAEGSDPFKDPESVLDEREIRWLDPMRPVTMWISESGFMILRFLLRLLFRIDVRGVERIPTEGAVVMAPNHCSYLDTPVLASVLPPRQRQRTYWAGWTGIAFSNPVSRLISRLGRVIPVDPDRRVASSLALAALVLERERMLVWFPEGHISENGTLQRFKPGAGMLLANTNAPVVPVRLHGTYDALPRHTFWPRIGMRITVTFGEPCESGTLEGEGEGDEDHQRITDALRTRLERTGQS